MNKSYRNHLAAGLLLVLLGAGVYSLATRQEEARPGQAWSAAPVGQQQTGGVKSGAPAPIPDQNWQPAAAAAAEPKLPVTGYGVTPRSTRETLSSTQGQANLLAHKEPQKNASQISSQIQGQPFDAVRWKNDPAYVAAYCAISEPSRGTTCSPDPKAPLLQRLSEIAPVVAHGSRIELRVRAAPGAPVSWASPSLGRFADSGLTSCTTVADASGVATATFEGVPGTWGQTDISVASPCNTGVLLFRIETVQADDKQASK
ncbi:MAG: hypothetical protein RL095_1922 [Verrucomicrobiota bacterium]